jgi:hypothetical protein
MKVHLHTDILRIRRNTVPLICSRSELLPGSGPVGFAYQLPWILLAEVRNIPISVGRGPSILSCGQLYQNISVICQQLDTVDSINLPIRLTVSLSPCRWVIFTGEFKPGQERSGPKTGCNCRLLMRYY